MDEATQTALIAGVLVVALLGAVWLLTRPPPPQDVSWQQAGQFVALVASL